MQRRAAMSADAPETPSAYGFPGTPFLDALKMFIVPLQPVSRPAPTPTM